MTSAILSIRQKVASKRVDNLENFMDRFGVCHHGKVVLSKFTPKELTQQTSLHELLLECRLNGGELLSGFVLLERLLSALLGQRVFFAFSEYYGLVLLAAQRQQVVGLVVLFEGGGIDGDDAVLHQCLGTDQFIVRGVVDNVENTSLACGCLRSPGKVSGFQTESTELAVSSTSSHKVDALASDLKIYNKHIEVRLFQNREVVLIARRSAQLTFVLLGGRPNSYFRFLRMDAFLPPVARRLWTESREIPARKQNENVHYLCFF